MATLVLQAAGAAIGGLFGPVGAILGGAVGAIAGYAVDQTLFGKSVEGPRLSDLSVQRSEEGTPIPRVYGRARLAGQVIWATRFQEVKQEEDGGKGGPSVTSYSYYANFAVAFAEGPIARLGRVWADGELIDMADVHHRFYRGTEDQPADSLIEAKQGAIGTPAYRGTAMVVFQRLPVGDYGNRLPQLAFEVFRPVGGVEEQIRAVVIIPGASEFGYDPLPVYTSGGRGRRVTVNRHVDGARTDWEASIDTLQALCPNLGRAALAVSWFGDDLRAGSCTIAPRVEDPATVTTPTSWRVSGVSRSAARAVSRVDGRPAFGGTPSDASVIRAIQDLKARSIAVTFYPFLMMDIPAGNDLPHPYWGGTQPAYPWRGEITASIAPGRPGTPDKTAAAAIEIAHFVGTASRTDFAVSGGAVVYSGPNEWSYRRMVLHAAHLCKAAGGVDAFLIGSELRGLTTLRSAASTYPFVAALKALAADVRLILPAAKLTYAADWSEYFGHQPGDGSGDVYFHLDPLWSDSAIDAIGIDSYVPLSDWRDGFDHLDAAIAESGRDVDYLRANIAGGEGFDWYYASDADRLAQIRSPITDGGAGKPWVFRAKDLVGWWSHPHFDRPAGVESATATSWTPKSKPIWFTEIGCPAIDKGANEPNVFPDPKVGGARLPHFSNGGRDALMQDRFLTAVLGYWDPAAPGFSSAANPASDVYSGRMVDPARTYVWSWDARPFPTFPQRTDIWSDGGNWQTGHWLNGRLGNLTTIRLLERILEDYGFSDYRIGDLDGLIDGFVIARVGSARQALQGLAEALGFEAAESGDVVRFVRRGLPRLALSPSDLVEDGEQPLLAIRRAQETELPAELSFGFIDGANDYRDRVVASRRLEAAGLRQAALSTGIVTDDASAVTLADQRLQEIWDGRETVSLALTDRRLAIEPADVVTLLRPEGRLSFRVTKVEDGLARRIEGRTVDPFGSSAATGLATEGSPEWSEDPGPPDVLVMDLPSLAGTETAAAARIALFADPWPGSFGVSIGSATSGFPLRQAIGQRAVMGSIAAGVPPGPVGRWDMATVLDVALPAGALASLPDEAVLNGRNIAAIGSEADGFEMIQFRAAELVEEGLWRLAGLLRGQGGTSDLAAVGHAAGARFVLINAATPLLELDPAEIGLARTLRAGPLAIAFDPDRFTTQDFRVAGRARLPLVPVHLTGRRNGVGDVHLRWIRQTRIGGDGWEQVEVPLGETVEAYRVDILEGVALKHSIEVAAPELALSAGELAAMLSAPHADFTARVRQLSATAGPGLATEILVHG